MKKTTTELTKQFINSLIANGNLYIEDLEIVYREDNINPLPPLDSENITYDKYGISKYKTDHGGSRLKGYTQLRLDFKNSNDKHKIKAAATTPEFAIVNKDLNQSQADLFYINNEKYMTSHSFYLNRASEHQKEKAAHIAFQALKEDGKSNLKNHLAIVGGNSAYAYASSQKAYENYLSLADNAAKRFLWNVYEQLSSNRWEK